MTRPNRVLLLASAITLLALNAESRAQNDRDQFLNPGTTGSQGIIGGRPGSSAGRSQRPRQVHRVKFGDHESDKFRSLPSDLERTVPSYIPDERHRSSSEVFQHYVGHVGGITLDESIETFVHTNLDLLQNREEITQAEADQITAGLRSNPVAYIDTQGVPYGKYSDQTTGGPVQYDLNVIYPIDFSRKRQARMASALLSKRAVETKFEDLVRLAIDNLSIAYIDALLAQRNLEFLERESKGDDAADVTELEMDTARETYNAAFESLALLLNMPVADLERRGLFGRIAYERREEPWIPSADELVQEALGCRPDIVSQRIIICRANADINVVLTSRFDDAQLLVQPFTYYSGITPGTPQNSVGWAIGLTIPLPIYNRQQGNIIKAQSIAAQMKLQTASLEKTVETEVRRAVRRHALTLKSVEKMVHELRGQDTEAAIDRLKERFGDKGSQPDKDLLRLMDHLDKIVESNEDEQLKKIDALMVEHRRSMLKLNTAVGRRILP